jgi:hypothetical protein
MRHKRITVSIPAEIVERAKTVCEKRELSLSEACARGLVRYLGLECPLCGKTHSEPMEGNTDHDRDPEST